MAICRSLLRFLATPIRVLSSAIARLRSSRSSVAARVSLRDPLARLYRIRSCVSERVSCGENRNEPPASESPSRMW